jgi:hypothetical protein
MGKRNQKEHREPPAPEKQNAEKMRQQIKEGVRADPKAKRGRVIAKVRNAAGEETFMAMGSDNALAIVAHR